MALLLDIRDPNWITESDLKAMLAPALPGVEIYIDDPTTERPDVTMLAVSKLYPGVARSLPNLQLVQKLGAGVDSIVADPDLPDAVRVTRLRPDAPAREIAEYCVAYVLRYQQNMLSHQRSEEASAWRPLPPRKSPETTVVVLGLGHIGGRVAAAFSYLGFRVIGWSRSPKSLEGVDCRHGADALVDILSDGDYVVSVLPSTPATHQLFDRSMLARMKPGSILVNVGRGDLVVDDDLLAAVASGSPGGAVLDVFNEEPLPADHPYWHHPAITVTPHVSGWHLDEGLRDVAENYRRLQAGEPLLYEVNRNLGY